MSEHIIEKFIQKIDSENTALKEDEELLKIRKEYGEYDNEVVDDEEEAEDDEDVLFNRRWYGE
jgi:hypothetical protein